MLKRLLVAVTLAAFAFGGLSLVGCAKKKAEEGTTGMETTPPSESATAAPAESGMVAPAESTPP